jgi:hypothetical protein
MPVVQGNHIYTSGATGTNAAVIRGALRAEKPDLLTVVLPQSLSMQPPESQELLAEVAALPRTCLNATTDCLVRLHVRMHHSGHSYEEPYMVHVLMQVKNVVSKPEADHLTLLEASRYAPLGHQPA